MAFALTLLAAAVAVAVELLEALAIVLAVGVERSFRDALIGAAGAVVAIAVVCVALGPALLGQADLHALQAVIGTALLLFGLEWLRKGVLRMAGRRARSSSYEEYVDERGALAAEAPGDGPDWAARTVAFKGVLLEGLEVALIVIALSGSDDGAVPAIAGAALATVVVIGIGLVLHRPLRRLPETQLKLGVGIALTAFGVFFTAEGLGVEWPGGDVALLYVLGLVAGSAWLAIGAESRARNEVAA